MLKLAPIDLETLLQSLPRREVDKADGLGWTACHWAALRGDLNAISLLLQYGADIEKRNENQYRPLDMALFSKNQAAIQLLLDSGCEANYLDGQGWLPLHVCCCLGFETGVIDTLLRKGLDINQGTRDSEDTPLMLAVQEDHVHVVKHLITRNAAVNAANYLGQCAIHIAIACDHAESLQVLLQHRVDHILKTKSLEDILHYAAQFAGLDVLRLLYRFDLHGIDPDDRVGATSDAQSMKVKGLTALEIAERRQDVPTEWLDVFRKLVEGIRYPASRTSLMPAEDVDDEFYDARE